MCVCVYCFKISAWPSEFSKKVKERKREKERNLIVAKDICS